MSMICPNCGSSFILSTETDHLCNSCGHRFITTNNSSTFQGVVEGVPVVLEDGIAVPRKIIQHSAQLRDDGIYLPTVLETFEGCGPSYYKAIPKDIFIDAVKQWVIPLLESELK